MTGASTVASGRMCAAGAVPRVYGPLAAWTLSGLHAWIGPAIALGRRWAMRKERRISLPVRTLGVSVDK